MIAIVYKNSFDEFELKTPVDPGCSGDGIYFTDDKQDAIDTAKFFYGTKTEVCFRRGTHAKGE